MEPITTYYEFLAGRKQLSLTCHMLQSDYKNVVVKSTQRHTKRMLRSSNLPRNFISHLISNRNLLNNVKRVLLQKVADISFMMATMFAILSLHFNIFQADVKNEFVAVFRCGTFTSPNTFAFNAIDRRSGTIRCVQHFIATR
jgi:hypothetical protein